VVSLSPAPFPISGQSEGTPDVGGSPLIYGGNMRATSIENYRLARASGVLSERRFQVCAALWDLKEATAREIWEYIKVRDQRAIPQHSINPRMVELLDASIVTESCTQACNFTGKAAIAWSLTTYIPAVWTRRKKELCPTCGQTLKRGATLKGQQRLF